MISLEERNSRIVELQKLLGELLSSEKLPVKHGTPPWKPGVYHILEKDTENSIYVGHAKDLHEEIYRAIVMGRHLLKEKLVKRCGMEDRKAAKQYLQNRCVFQCILVEDKSIRATLEHFVISILRPTCND